VNLRLLTSSLACLLGLLAMPASALAGEEDFLYDPSTVSVIQMTLPEAEIQKLEADPFTYVKGGTVSVTPTDGTPPADGKGTPTATFNNVEVKLKGQLQGSFEDLGHKAAFKLKFKKAEPFYGGLRKLTLNNMTQDPSMIHESLAYGAFRAAGVPASRSGYAYVWLNGKNYGLHLNLESLDTVSLPKIFAVPEFDSEHQHLYEAAKYGADFYPGKEPMFEVDEGEDDTSDLTALIAAVDAAVPGGTITPDLAARVDLDEMTRMWGVEKYIGHWDGYAGQGIAGEPGFNEHRPNNYYLYSDLAGRFQMLPWGTDQAWDVGDTGGVPMPFDGQDGRLFDLCRADAECAGRFSAAVANALDKVGGLDLEDQAEATAELLEPWQALEAAPRKPYDAGQIADAVDDTIEFVADRPAEAEAWLLEHPPPAKEGEVVIGPGVVTTETLRETAPTSTPAARPEAPRIPVKGVTELGVEKGAGVVRLRLRAAVAGEATLVGRSPLAGKRRNVCGDELEVKRPRDFAIACRVSPRGLQRLRNHDLPIYLRLAFIADDGQETVLARQVTLPRQ
jgi:CotH protein